MYFCTREDIGKKSFKYFGDEINKEIRNNIISRGFHKFFPIPEEVDSITIYKNLCIMIIEEIWMKILKSSRGESSLVRIISPCSWISKVGDNNFNLCSRFADSGKFFHYFSQISDMFKNMSRVDFIKGISFKRIRKSIQIKNHINSW